MEEFLKHFILKQKIFLSVEC